MSDLHELTRIIGLVAIGLTACVCLYKLGVWAIRKLDSPCPPELRAAVRPVPDEQADNVTSITNAVGFERERKRA